MSELDRTRLGNCYELAGQYVMEDRSRELVHGTIQRDPFPPNPHAWVEFEGGGRWEDPWLVWEPVSDEIYPRPVFYALFGAEVHNRYTFKAQWAMLQEHRDWGPWEGDYWQVNDARKVIGEGEPDAS